MSFDDDASESLYECAAGVMKLLRGLRAISGDENESRGAFPGCALRKHGGAPRGASRLQSSRLRADLDDNTVYHLRTSQPYSDP